MVIAGKWSVSPGGIDQQRLSRLNQLRLRPAFPDDESGNEPAWQAQAREDERRFVEEERRQVAPLVAGCPSEPEAFVRWFEALERTGPGQGDELFAWLARTASAAQMRWFLGQEVAGEAGFEDLVALTQVRMPTRAKLEMGRNYWDELGQGHEEGMHGPLLDRLASALDVRLPPSEIVDEALALGNLMAAFACNRRYAYQSVGALGAIELTAPGRAEQVNAGLSRLGVPARVRKYFALHATLDVKHARAWNREVLTTLVAADPRTARAMAEGALMRLRAGARCFERYRSHLFSHARLAG